MSPSRNWPYAGKRRFFRAAWTRGLALMALLGVSGRAEDGPHAKRYDDQILPLLKRHCTSCHGMEKPKGDLRLDQLSSNFESPVAQEGWQVVLKRVNAGEMPPQPQPRLTEADLRLLTDWIEAGVAAGEAARRAQGRTVLRRLNRVEYGNTVRDLLAIDLDLEEMLPVDSSAEGFDNVGEAHHVSSFLMERYLEAAEAVLDVAIANFPQPPSVKTRHRCQDERHVQSTTEKVFRDTQEALVFFSSSAWQGVTLSQFYPPHRGRYRFRISASGFQSSGKPVVFRVDAGPMLMATKNHLVSYFDAQPDKTKVFEFVEHLEARSTIRLLPYGLASAQVVDKIGADKYGGPGLAVDWIEVEGPLHDAWPPESHRRIFGDLRQAPSPTVNRPDRVEVVSDAPEADAQRILYDFARRACRRAVTGEDTRPFVDLVKARLAAGSSFEQAMRVGLKGILVSPGFLFLRESPGTLDDFALASRLSYFLWSTTPDQELLELAEQGKLRQPDVLRGQVERMLGHRRAEAFVKNFVGQWLGLRDIDFTEPSHILYPEFDDMLKESMVRETELFFAEVLKNDLSLANFVSSDFTMLNGRLAEHYDLPDVDGWEFRKVTLAAGSHRGGLLTMASVLKVTANGTSTSPVIRGAWVLERILGTPPPRPPADVPALEPDIRGATTIREQLAKHRQIATCAACHARIDPPGFALESFDVIGGWREHYRTSGNGEYIVKDGRQMPYLKGPKVDPADALADGRSFRNIDDFKQLLLQDKDQLARSLVHRLLTYATGGRSSPADQAELEAVVAKAREKDYGLRTVVHEIVQSPLFQKK